MLTLSEADSGSSKFLFYPEYSMAGESKTESWGKLLANDDTWVFVIEPIGSTLTTHYQLRHSLQTRCTVGTGEDPYQLAQNRTYYFTPLVVQGKGEDEKDLSVPTSLFWERIDTDNRFISLKPEKVAGAAKGKDAEEADTGTGTGAGTGTGTDTDTGGSGSEESAIKVRYLLREDSHWYDPLGDKGCELCNAENGEETALMIGNRSTTLPQSIILFPSDKPKSVFAKREDLEPLFGCIQYGHTERGYNHFQHRLILDELLRKYLDPDSAYRRSIDNKLAEWREGIRKEHTGFNIIVTPNNP